MRKLLAGVVIVIVATGLAACGDDDDSGTIEPATSDAADGGTVEVIAEGSAFTPTSAEVAAGPVHFSVENKDSVPHTFTIDDADVDIALDPDSSGEADAELEAGDFEWRCTIHPSMTGTLTVT